jgi:membrane protein
MIAKAIEWYKKAFRFITYDMWHLDMAHYNRRDAFLIKQLKIVTITFRRFFRDKVIIRCSALSYYSILAVVPALAIVFAIAKGLGVSDALRYSLEQRFDGYNDIIDFLMQFADKALANTRAGVLSSLGIAFLLWSVVKVLNNIENAFNYVWQVKRPRPLSRKFTDYFAFILIMPLMLAFSSTISLSIRYHVGHLTEGIPLLEHAGPLFGTLAPFVVVYLLLSFMYVTVPYTRVKIAPAIIAALIAGTAFQLVQNLYIFSQISVSKYSAIYGAFAAIPLLCVWLQVSWIIVLFGAELTFAYQNLERYHYEVTSTHISPFQRKVTAILVARLIAKRFARGGEPYTAEELSQELDLPHRVVRNSMEDLLKCHIVTEVAIQSKRKSKDNAYLPLIDIHSLTIAYVYDALDKMGQVPLAARDNTEMQKVMEILSAPAKVFEKGDGQLLLINI